MKRFLLVLLGFWIGLTSLKAQNPGDLDLSFNAVRINMGQRPNQFVHTSVRQSYGEIISVGNFTSYNGSGRNRIIRINLDG